MQITINLTVAEVENLLIRAVQAQLGPAFKVKFVQGADYMPLPGVNIIACEARADDEAPDAGDKA